MAADEMRRLVTLLENAMIAEGSYSPFDASVKFTDWSNFLNALDQATTHGFSSEEELCSLVGIEYKLYNSLIHLAIHAWRDSTTTSILHGISHINLDRPLTGSQVFPDLVWQTRFILMLIKERYLRGFDVSKIPDPNKPISEPGRKFLMIKNEYALTCKDEILTPYLQILYLYNFFNHNKQIKDKLRLPKYLYRGVRAHDLWNHTNLVDILSSIWKNDTKYELQRRDAINKVRDYIISNGINHIADGRILSFTSSLPIAKYFSNGEGFILRIDPRMVHIVTSEIHDETRVGGSDAVSGKNEREYIVRIPDDYKFTRDDIIINDLDYWVAEQNPLCVALLSHDDKEATYTMNGISIRARFNWNAAGTKGSLRFNGVPRVQFKQTHGFDPLPTIENLDQIKDFKVQHQPLYGRYY